MGSTQATGIAKGRLIPLDQLAELVEVDGPAQVVREAIRRRIIVQCNVRGRDLASFVAEAQRTVDKRKRKVAGYMVTWGGTQKTKRQAVSDSPHASAHQVLIFFLLHTSLGSASLAILIYLNVRIGRHRVWLRGLPLLDFPQGVGFIALFRVRPCLMESYDHIHRRTSRAGRIDTHRVLLLQPCETGSHDHNLPDGDLQRVRVQEVQHTLAKIIVIGGLVTSTLLTLLVLPTIYSWF